MKIKKYLIYLILSLIFISILAIGMYCHFLHDNKPTVPVENHTLHFVETNKLPQEPVKISQAKIVIPQGYQLLSQSLHETSYIGTVDHPTIDGGMINRFDGLPISHEEPKTIENKKEELHQSNATEKLPFQDQWVTDQHVKKLLESAAHNGKLEYVLNESAEVGIPASIAILPMVESGYKENALSNKGAAGAWQIMPSVAKQYGISSDERFQFKASTDTALKLLSDLHKQFHNWDLTLAAYNAGSSRVNRALLKNPKAESIDELDLPKETKSYVNRIKSIHQLLGEYHGLDI
jgi:hypothetical protein